MTDLIKLLDKNVKPAIYTWGKITGFYCYV